MKAVQCVPNFSEGRRRDVVESIADEMRVAGAKVVDVEMDPDHNRSVITLVGEPEAVAEAMFKGARKAVALIDMESHRGEHPRIGAVDVVPFVPLRNVTMAECVELARRFGRRLAEELGVPVYLYEEAATRPQYRNLADVRKGEYEGLKADILTNPDRRPDFGPSKLHGSAGATAVGARMPLVAYNVNLDTSDLRIAKRIAKRVRERDGGLPFVKALGFEIRERGFVQVSMNLTNHHVTPVWKAYEEVEREARALGVKVLGSEVVGTIPMEALVACASRHLGLEKFDSRQVLESRLWED